MKSILDRISAFLESEKAKAGRWNRLVRNYPEVINTRMLAWDPGIPKKPEKVYRPSIGFRIIGGVFLVGGLGMWVLVFGALLSREIPWWIGLFFLLFVSAWIRALGIFFLKKKYNYELRIGPFGVAVDGRSVAWNEIEETAIMIKYGGRTTTLCLILFLRDGSTNVLNLQMLASNEKKVAAVVEQYKAEAMK